VHVCARRFFGVPPRPGSVSTNSVLRTDESEFGVLNKFNVLFALEFSSRFYFTAVGEKTGTDKFLEIKRSLRAIFSRP
jgi:hypothetical protein